MIKHIVMWNYKENCRMADIDEISFQLLQLKKLDEVLDLTIHKSNMKSSTKDFCLIVNLLNEKDLQAYLAKAEHQKVLNLINKSFCKRECFDVDF